METPNWNTKSLSDRLNARLTPEQVDLFQKNGFVLIENVLTENEIKKAREAYWRIYEKCMDGSYRHFRYFDQLTDYHVYGIEHIFHPQIFEEDLFRAAINSGLLSMSEQLLGSKDYFMALNRIQCTQNFSYSGYWHRDSESSSLDHVQSGLYLFPETRFYVVPGSHNRPDSPLEAKVRRENCWRGDLPGQLRLRSPAGSMLLFHSSVIHRAACVGHAPYNRAYLHFRIAKLEISSTLPRMAGDEEHFRRPEVLQICDDRWRTLFSRTDVGSPPELTPMIVAGNPKRSVSDLAKKLIARVAYHLLWWIPEGSMFFAKHRRFVPKLKPDSGFEID